MSNSKLKKLGIYKFSYSWVLGEVRVAIPCRGNERCLHLKKCGLSICGMPPNWIN